MGYCAQNEAEASADSASPLEGVSGIISVPFAAGSKGIYLCAHAPSQVEGFHLSYLRSLLKHLLTTWPNCTSGDASVGTALDFMLCSIVHASSSENREEKLLLFFGDMRALCTVQAVSGSSPRSCINTIFPSHCQSCFALLGIELVPM